MDWRRALILLVLSNPSLGKGVAEPQPVLQAPLKQVPMDNGVWVRTLTLMKVGERVTSLRLREVKPFYCPPGMGCILIAPTEITTEFFLRSVSERECARLYSARSKSGE